MSDTTKKSRSGLWAAIGIAAVVGIFVLTFLTTGTGSSGAYDIEAFGDPAITGEWLPMMEPGSGGINLNDPAAGLAAPEVSGKDYNGNPVSITNDGTPKIIVFLAHWCPHCQAEVPRITARLGTGSMSDGVAWYGVATASNSTRDNWPPAAWLDGEGFPAPVIMDDINSSVLDSYGISSFPGWAVVGADGTILARATGELPPDAVDAVVALAASTLP